MKELLKAIRTRLHMNQEQFARALGVSAVTANRWENGKSIPSLMAQNQVYELAASHQLNLLDVLLPSPTNAGNGLSLFHASRAGIQGPIRPISRSRCDFGRGFYMGTDPLQPLTLVCNEAKPLFYSLELNPEGLRCLEVAVNLDWAMLIAYYRGYLAGAEGSALYEKYAHMADGYDILVGYIADDRMYQVLTDFFEGRITDAALLGSLSALKLGRQYVAITEKACRQIAIKEERQLSMLELRLLQDFSSARRKEGLALADRMVKEHRRDGLYFDEILQGAE